jgi:predicted RNase H-like HicB family nuclease
MTTAWFTFVCSRATIPTPGAFWRTLRIADDTPAFRAVYEHDAADGSWLVRIEGLDGCHTYGRTKPEAADRIEEALAAWLDKEPSGFKLTHA